MRVSANSITTRPTNSKAPTRSAPCVEVSIVASRFNMAVQARWAETRRGSETRRRPDSNWGIELLQSPALPLGYVAVSPGGWPAPLERVAGIEPARQPWEGRRLPLHHTREPVRVSLR